MHVLILHMRYWPDPTGTGPLVTDLARGLVGRGEQVTVITSAPHYGRSAVPAEYRWRPVVREVDQGVRVWRTAAFPRWSASLLGRGVDYALYTGLAAVLALGVKRPDVVLAVAPPITVAAVGWLVSRIRAAPLVYNAQDIWPDGLQQMGRLKPGRVLDFLRRMEAWVYSIADRIVVVSEGMSENLVRKGVAERKLAIVHNWVDTREIRPKGESRIRPELGLERQFVVLFAGNLGYASGLESVLEAAQVLNADEGIHFLIVGEGSAKAGLVERAEAQGLDNLTFLSTQPRERLNDLLASSDVGLVTLRAGMGDLSVPSKTYTYMAAGKPVLAAVPENSDIRRIVDSAACGLWVPAESPEALAEAIQDLSRRSSELQTMGRNARDYAVHHFSREAAIGAYRSLLGEGITGSG